MTLDLECPQCGSKRVKVCYPHIDCLSCGWSEPLIDFPISFGSHRSLCMEFGQPDPGPRNPPKHSVEELHRRVLALEESPRLEVERSHKKPKLAGGVRL